MTDYGVSQANSLLSDNTLLSNQFDIGDIVQIGDHVGIVQNVGIRFTVQQNAMGADVMIPNRSITNVIN